jgi:hypothetical protein
MIFAETGQNNPIQGAQPHPNTIVRPRRETRLSTERAIVLASVPNRRPATSMVYADGITAVLVAT